MIKWVLGLFAGRWALLAQSLLVAAVIGLAVHWVGNRVAAFAKKHHDAGEAVGYQRGHAEAIDLQQRWDAEKISRQHLALQAEQRRRKDEAATAAKQKEALDAQIQRAAVLAADRV